MAGRWTLNRAGIINVYQYGQETLHFAGGRLLLRGVNGSGKSTAMNMLLPFLLDGDTRRIDAAGEQAGVLKSWMLAGRDDPQPIGYLWIEFARGEEHVTCGCGIKANRSSDSVTTWWFVTSRRPGIDLDLVEARHPLSAETLRATLGIDPVFRHEQRIAYRAEVRARLFGGADIDQHVRLLHVVRNPRVGDRIDVELPGYLHDALPQLSDAALDDAAQPLDDLEEHRRNVEDLTRTAAALDALGAVYSSYARGELRRRAAQARELVEEADRADRQLVEAQRASERAASILAGASARVAVLEAEESRLRRELEGLRESPAYKDGRELNNLRDHVASLDMAVGRAADHVERRIEATSTSRRSLAGAEQVAVEDREALSAGLRDLAPYIVLAGLPLGVPGAPAIETQGVGATDAGEPAPEAPVTELDPAILRRGLEEVRGAVVHRKGDVVEVRESLDAVERAERLLTEAGRAWDAAAAEAEATQEAAGLARQSLDDAVIAWRADLHAWVERLDGHRLAHGMGGTAVPDLAADLVARRGDVAVALADAAHATLEAHLDAKATLDARRKAEQATADALASAVAELDARMLPAPPALPWQRDERGVVLAELVDFHESVGAQHRAGVEAAMEAAGILGAEVTSDGALQLADGGLLLQAGPPAAAPLSRLLTITVADEHAARVDASAVARLLDAISTDSAALDAAEDVTVVTPDGRFRTGVLRGRHAKPDAEHIGLTARRALLDRQRAEARDALEEALALLARTVDELAAAAARIEDARAIHAELPSATSVTEALLGSELADVATARARERRDERLAERIRAEEAHTDAVETSRRTAANLGLPADPDGLHRIDDALEESRRLTLRADDRLAGLVRAVAQWRVAAQGWLEAVDEERRARTAHFTAIAEHEPVAARLATLEDSVGVAYEEIVAAVGACETDLTRTTREIDAARTAEHERLAEVSSAGERVVGLRMRHSEAAGRAVAALPRLRRTLQVPGVLSAALGTSTTGTPVVAKAGPRAEVDPSPARTPGSVFAGTAAPAAAAALLAPVDETTDGVRSLAAAIEAHVPTPERADVGAEGVRSSLRQRRDALGSGWDAEDRQADESLPLTVEVNGPQGRLPLPDAAALVGARLRELAVLLSSEQDGALRNLLQGLVAREVADKLGAAKDLVALMNRRLDTVTTSHGIGVSLRWRRRDSLGSGLGDMIDLLAKPPDLRTTEQEDELRAALSERLGEARRDDPEAPYRDLIGRVLDYRSWHEMTLVLHRPGRPDERLTRRTALSEGEKKIVSYLPLFAAVAASCDSLAESAPDAPRFVLLDDAFAKVSEDNHSKLFGLLVQLDLDFIATSERLWGTHASVPELAITEVLRDADLGVIILEHSRWDGLCRTAHK